MHPIDRKRFAPQQLYYAFGKNTNGEVEYTISLTIDGAIRSFDEQHPNIKILGIAVYEYEHTHAYVRIRVDI